MSTNEVLYAVSDHIATITLNAPERMNTISRAMLNDLSAALLRANQDVAVRCLVLTGAGRAFCAGLDLREAKPGNTSGIANDNSTRTTLDLRNTPPTVLQAMDKPTMCAVNGGAAGYGMDTALGCDIRIMARRRTWLRACAPSCKNANPTSRARYGPPPTRFARALKGATPAARQSRFRGVHLVWPDGIPCLGRLK